MANYNGTSGDDVYTGTADDDGIYGGAGNDTLRGGDGNDTVTGDGGDDVLEGGLGNDSLQGGTGADQLDGGDGDDLLTGFDGDDIIVGGGGADWLTGGGDGDRIHGNDGDDRLSGDHGDDFLYGGDGDDVIEGGSGTNTLDGGAGNDTWSFAGLGYGVTAQLGGAGGSPMAGSQDTATGFENLRGSSNNDVLTGNAGANRIEGRSGNDRLDGRGGADTLIGGAGNDTFVIDNVDDSVTEDAYAGTDTVESAITYTLGANLEDLVLTGGAPIDGTGNAGRNSLNGNAGRNTLDGGAGMDTMAGGGSNDTYIVDNVHDRAIELAGGGTDLVRSSVTYMLSAEVENLTLTGGAPIDGTGNALANVITGNAGRNRLDGGDGADTMIGGAGNDTYVVDETGDSIVELAGSGTDTIESWLSYTLTNHLENLTLMGGGALDATGNALANVLTGNAGRNTLDGKAGADILIGGGGNDTYAIDTSLDRVIEYAGGGTDTVQSSVTYTLGSEVENLTLTGSLAINGTGNALANLLTGNAAANLLNGGAGADTMTGGAGNDIYVVDNAGDQAFELAGGGTDTVQSAIGFTLANDLENLTLTGSAAIDGTGNALANSLLGNAAANVLNGGGGADMMRGLGGNDVYVVDNAGDRVFEVGGGGTDTVRTSISLALAGEVENLVLTGAAAINGYGNTLANILTGNAAANVLDGGLGGDEMIGGAGDDIYVVENGGDLVLELTGGGTDTVRSALTYALNDALENLTLTGSAPINATGSAFANILTGNSASNVLNGGGGADTMTGLAGDDRYEVDNVGDLVFEAAGGGFDIVSSSASFAIGDNIENLILTGSAPINGTGNADWNTLVGNDADNVLDGMAGGDMMVGAAGNDTYVVDSISDTVFEESASGGVDTVQSFVPHALAANVENLVLLGSAGMTGAGNELANTITGNSGTNLLDGAAGADTLIGGDGDDLYHFDTAGDQAIETSADGGFDAVYSSVSSLLGANIEALHLTGSATIDGTGNDLANTMSGNSAANLIDGGAGADVLIVGDGADRLIGGTGADSFHVRNGLEGSDGFATILDFSSGEDTIMLDRSEFGALPGQGPVAASAFHIGTEAHDADDRIVYDQASGTLFYDADGNGAGAAMLFLQVTDGTMLSSTDFQAY